MLKFALHCGIVMYRHLVLVLWHWHFGVGIVALACYVCPVVLASSFGVVRYLEMAWLYYIFSRNSVTTPSVDIIVYGDSSFQNICACAHAHFCICRWWAFIIIEATRSGHHLSIMCVRVNGDIRAIVPWMATITTAWSVLYYPHTLNPHPASCPHPPFLPCSARTNGCFQQSFFTRNPISCREEGGGLGAECPAAHNNPSRRQTICANNGCDVICAVELHWISFWTRNIQDSQCQAGWPRRFGV